MRLLIISLLMAVLLPCASTFAQWEPCDLNQNGYVDVADLVTFVNIFERITQPPYELPIYDPRFDCDRDGLHLTINDLVGLRYRMIHGYSWGFGRQWWLPADSLIIPEIELSPGVLTKIPLYVQTDHPLANVQFSLRYDPELLQIDDFVLSDSVPNGLSPSVYTFHGGISVIVHLADYDDEVFYSGPLGDLEARALVGDPQELQTTIEFFTEPHLAFYNGICSFDYMHDAPGIQLFFTHPTTVDGIIRIVDSGRLGGSALGASGIDLRAYPNPFNSAVEITVEVESESEARIAVFDLLGREVARLHDGRLPAGSNTLVWRPDDQPSGVYFCRVEARGREIARRVTLLR